MNEADLFAAASDDDAEAVRNILADGVDVDARNGAGETPLLVATRRNAVKAARALMEAGADVNAKDRIHDSPYLYAGARGHIEILEMTLAHGADLESTNRFGGTTLIPASERGHVETVRRLIAAGVNVDHVNRLGWTALIEAIILSDGGPWHQEIVQALVDAGANVNLADGEGASPLSLARRQGHMKIAHPREGRRRMSQAIATNEARAATGSAGSTAGVVKQADTRRAAWPLLLVVAIVGLNLRPFITGVGPLAEGIRDETGLGLQGLSLLTLVPMLLMGLVGFAGPSLQSAVGVRRSIIAALAVLCVGSLLRLFSVTGWELIETAALIGCGAAIVQAMFPGVVKRVFPGHVAKVMGLYSAMLMSGGALGAKASPIIAGHAGSWHLGLAWLALPAGLAVLLAAVYLPANEQSESRRNVTTELLRRPRAWLLMLCFGLVNGG